MNNRRLPAILAFLLVIGTLVVYWPARQFEFINYDDEDYVYANPTVAKGLTTEGVKWAFTTGFIANWHPLTWLSHMLDCELWGVNSGAHHMMNVVFHTAATVALFFALLRMTRAAGRSAMVAALFALHPLHVGSVAWVAERKDVLSGLFWMLTMWAYVWYTERPGLWRYLLVAMTFTLGLMAKSMLVTLPCVLLLLDYWPLKRLVRTLSLSDSGSAGTLRPTRSVAMLITEKVPLFALSAAASVVTLMVQRAGGAVYDFAKELSLGARIANALVAYVSYLGKTLLPENLAALYPHPGHWPVWQVVGATIILLLITMAVIAFAKPRPYLAMGWFWFLGTLVPVIGVVQVGEQYMADRYSYIPLVGIFIALVWWISDVLATVPQRKVAIGFATMVVLAMCVVGTRRQLGYWENSVKLFARTVELTTDNATAQYNLAQALSVRGYLKQSVPHYEEALRVRPNYPEALNNLGFTKALLGQLIEATNYYEKALKVAPRSASAHLNYGFALLNLGKPEEAATRFQTALKGGAPLAMAHFGYGRALLGTGKLDESMAEFREALRHDPSYAEAMFYLGLALVEKGDREQGVKEMRRAAELAPRAPDVHMQLGKVYTGQGKAREAVAEYKEALRLNANYPEALNNYAWLLATHSDAEIRNGHLAVDLGERACELTKYEVPQIVGTLAAAYAEAGRFDDAIKTGERARDLAAAQQQEGLAKKNSELIALYKAGKAYREN
jgi:protein O-mannosyl-transferase